MRHGPSPELGIDTTDSGCASARWTRRQSGGRRRFPGERVLNLIAGRDVRVITAVGHPLGHFVLDPAVGCRHRP